MSGNASTNPEQIYADWSKVGKALEEAARLSIRETAAYLDWGQNLQREILEQAWRSAQLLSQVGEERMAFWARLSQSMPAPGTVPNGTETIQGMVRQIVEETVPQKE
jgi:hypothetical protein